jgi:hypothetical protein
VHCFYPSAWFIKLGQPAKACFNLTNTIETVKLVAFRLRHSRADLHNWGDLPCTQPAHYAGRDTTQLARVPLFDMFLQEFFSTTVTLPFVFISFAVTTAMEWMTSSQIGAPVCIEDKFLGTTATEPRSAKYCTW